MYMESSFSLTWILLSMLRYIAGPVAFASAALSFAQMGRDSSDKPIVAGTVNIWCTKRSGPFRYCQPYVS